MDDSEFQSYLRERYESQIKWYDEKSASNKKWFKYLEISLIISSALTPILIVIDFISTQFIAFRWISVVTSFLTVILASSLKTFKFNENWVNYRSTAESLKKEQYLYKANASEYSKAQDKEAFFVQRVENLISRAHTSWVDEYQLRPETEK